MSQTTSRSHRFTVAAACALAMASFASPSAKADYTWLGNDTTFGGSGTWDNATTASWSTDGISTVPSIWSAGNIAAFTTATGTVTVDGIVQGVNGLKFPVAYTLSAINGGALNFPSTASQQYTIDVTAATSIAAILSGGASTSNINKTGAGTLTLSGNNTFSLIPSSTTVPTVTVVGGGTAIIGGFTVTAGTVEFLGDNSGVTGQFNTNSSGATLAVGSNTALGTTNRIRFHTAGGIIRSTDTTKRTLANAVDLATSATFGSSNAATNGDLEFTTTGFGAGSGAKTLTVLNTTTISGIITGGPSTNNITKAGNGTLVLSGANSYDRPTEVLAGTLRITLSGRLGSPTNNKTVFVGDAGLLDLQVAAFSDAATLSLTSTDSVAELNIGSGINDFLSTFILNGVTMAPGTYGSATSGALNPGLANPNDVFSGSGILTVTVPEPSSALLSAFAACGLLARRRQRSR